MNDFADSFGGYERFVHILHFCPMLYQGKRWGGWPSQIAIVHKLQYCTLCPSLPVRPGSLRVAQCSERGQAICARPAVGPSRVFGRSERRSVAPCAAEQFLVLPDLDATCPSNCVDCLQGVRPRDMVFPGLLVFRPESVPGLPTPGRLRTAPNAGRKALSQVLQTRAWGCASMGA